MARRDLLRFFAGEAMRGGLTAAGEACRFEYLQVSKLFILPPGFHDVEIELELAQGGLTVGLVDWRGAWRNSTNISSSGRHRLQLITYGPVSLARVVVAACNAQAPGPVRGVVLGLTLDSALMRRGALRAAAQRALERYRTDLLPRLYQAALRCRVWASRLGLAARYRVIDVATIGYASRGIAALALPEGTALVTADVGDDSLSVLPVRGGRLRPRSVIACPPRSAPMYVSGLRFADGDRAIVSLFNFDESGQSFGETLIGIVDDLPGAVRRGKIAPDEGLRPLIRRAGHWGFRGSALHQLADGRYRLASVDRERNLFYLLDGTAGGEARAPQVLDLGVSSEPIGINFAPPPPGSLPCDYYLSCRKTAEIVQVRVSAEGRAAVHARYAAPGLSRSSVAVAQTRSRGSWEVLIAQWGGDPTDLNASGRGTFVALPIAADGGLGKALCTDAGTNPTDILAGDLDGDGLDEVVVLNFGNGLNVAERTDCGNVEIYKWRDRGYARVARIGIPSPRIGLVADLDGDGRPELAVTAFYERRLAVVKF